MTLTGDPLLSVYFDAFERAENKVPEGMSFALVTENEELARRAAPLLADVLCPDRRFGNVLHAERMPDVDGKPQYEVVLADLGPRSLVIQEVPR